MNPAQKKNFIILFAVIVVSTLVSIMYFMNKEADVAAAERAERQQQGTQKGN